jgi:hypothetical protein
MQACADIICVKKHVMPNRRMHLHSNTPQHSTEPATERGVAPYGP